MHVWPFVRVRQYRPHILRRMTRIRSWSALLAGTRRPEIEVVIESFILVRHDAHQYASSSLVMMSTRILFPSVDLSPLRFFYWSKPTLYNIYVMNIIFIINLLSILFSNDLLLFFMTRFHFTPSLWTSCMRNYRP